ncbi:MAG TPA: FABP family protein [Jatrophihabitans sp.]|nr:FABP family protein [Jatrophihabitans sp.]
MTVPELSDTTDLRTGPALHQELLAVLPLVGWWDGHGTGVRPADGETFDYAQRISFSHDGRPWLGYESRAWLLNPDGSVLRPAFRENGFLRLGADPDQLELVMTSAAGIVSVFTGVAGDRRWEFATTAVGFTPTAKQVSGERRLYALGQADESESLAYVTELALLPGEYRPHLNAQLARRRHA